MEFAPLGAGLFVFIIELKSIEIIMAGYYGEHHKKFEKSPLGHVNVAVIASLLALCVVTSHKDSNADPYFFAVSQDNLLNKQSVWQWFKTYFVSL